MIAEIKIKHTEDLENVAILMVGTQLNHWIVFYCHKVNINKEEYYKFIINEKQNSVLQNFSAHLNDIINELLENKFIIHIKKNEYRITNLLLLSIL